jgi:Bacterial archaeo-eukaryotic release factor family 7
MIFDYPKQQDLENLSQIHKPLCLTVHLKSSEADEDVGHRRIELKNLIKESQKALNGAKARREVIGDMLRPLKDLLENKELLATYTSDLVYFSNPTMSQIFILPDHKVADSMQVMNFFDAEHLSQFIEDNKSYIVLTLSHNKVSLFEGDKFMLKPVKLKDFPTNMKDALQIDEYPKWLESHSIAPASQGRGSRAFHGQYNIHQTDKDMLLKFFRQIDHKLRSYLQAKKEPLILGGVEYLLPIYQKANTSKSLYYKHLKGNLEHVTLPNLRVKATGILANS